MDTFENQKDHMTDSVQAVATQVAPVAVQANNPMAMIAAAVARGVDTDQLTKLMDLQERWEKNEARKAFAAAMVAFKAEPIEILKNSHVSYTTSKGTTEYDHATLHNVCAQIIAALGKNGIAHTWKPSTQDGKVSVTCILRHSMGHEESVTLDAKADDSGGKNGIQAIGSTITYLQRYSLLAATGLAVKGQDDDGNGTGGERGMPIAQYEQFAKEIEACTKKDKARTVYDRALAICVELDDPATKDKLKAVLLAHGKFIDNANKVAA